MAQDSTDGGLCFVVTVLRTGLAGAEGRPAAIGRNQCEVTIADQQKHERHEERHDDRQARSLRQNKGRFVFIDGASPDDPRAGRGQAMMASIAIPPAVEIEGPRLRLLPIGKAGRADDSRRKANADEQTGKKGNQPVDPAGSFAGMHGVKKIVHRLFLQKKGRVAYDTAQERVYRCLLTDATVQAVKRRM